MIVVWLFLAMLWDCLQFVIVVFSYHAHFLFLHQSRLHSNNVLNLSVSNSNCYMIISGFKYPGHLEYIHSAFEKVYFL